jgi:hypothetical protein
MNWKYLVGAIVVVAAALLRAGAPILPIAVGAIAAGLWSYRNSVRSKLI